jgi:hypothetical protein
MELTQRLNQCNRISPYDCQRPQLNSCTSFPFFNVPPPLQPVGVTPLYSNHSANRKVLKLRQLTARIIGEIRQLANSEQKSSCETIEITYEKRASCCWTDLQF